MKLGKFYHFAELLELVNEPGSTPAASTTFSQSSRDDENRCSLGAVSTRDALAQELEKATRRWVSDGDVRPLRRALLGVLMLLEDAD